MVRINGFYLYSVGYSVHPLAGISDGASFQEWVIPLLVAQGTLQEFLDQSVFRFSTCRASGLKLLEVIRGLVRDTDRQDDITVHEAYGITSTVSEFEHVLSAELGLMDIYLVLRKRGYDTSILIQNGQDVFPPELQAKVPEAVADIKQATACIAFELSTAAGFHLHRANESVLHAYYDSVTGGAPRPPGRNIGDYLAGLKNLNKGDPKVIAALQSLKDLHRNPLIHPSESLEGIDDAIALLGTVHAAVVSMLKGIPEPKKLAAAT